MWAWRQRVAREMRNFALTELPRGKVRRDWKNKAGAFAECGRTVAALACQGCGGASLASGTLVATCGMRTCPICARRKAEKLRHRLSSAWKQAHHDRKTSLYFLTFTMRYDPTDPDEVSVAGLLRRKNELVECWGKVWRNYLKKRGEAACRAIEVGASGMVHMHVLYAGRRPEIEDLRSEWLRLTNGSSPLVNVRYCKDPQKAIVELAKYVTKGASPAKAAIVGGARGKYIDPRLAVRVEIAFSGDRIVQCYGKWLGIKVDDIEEVLPEEVQEQRELHKAACDSCGLVGEWRAIAFSLNAWIHTWGDSLARWKPRIGGSGPRRKEDHDHEPKRKRKQWISRWQRADGSIACVCDNSSEATRRSEGADRPRPEWAEGIRAELDQGR
jgi:hypothetical protein